MKITLFGASGGTGRQVVEQALQRGDEVTALVRDPSKLDIKNNLLTVLRGNVLDADDVKAAVQGADAVVISLGNTPNNPDKVVSQGTVLIIEAMNDANCRRVVAVSSLGVGDSKDQVPFAFKAIMATVLRKAMEDKEAQEALLRASDLDWTIVRPGGLTDGPFTGVYRSGLDPKLMAGQIARADVAHFVLHELDTGEYLHQTPAVT